MLRWATDELARCWRRPRKAEGGSKTRIVASRTWVGGQITASRATPRAERECSIRPDRLGGRLSLLVAVALGADCG